MADVFLVYEALEYEGWWLLGAYSSKDAALEHKRIVEEGMRRYSEPIIVRRTTLTASINDPASLLAKTEFRDGSYWIRPAQAEQELIDG